LTGISWWRTFFRVFPIKPALLPSGDEDKRDLPGGGEKNVVIVDKENFEQEVLQAGGLVVVDFGALNVNPARP
jgi:hypothetical protein